MEKIRIDTLLHQQGKTESREKARAIIMAGIVFLNGKRIDKPGTMVSAESEPEVRGAALPYVSRGGLKLEKALSAFGVTPADRCCLDAGASTGGFTDCLLQNGARHVYAVDVGYGQLNWNLRQDSRVTVLERTNIRYLTAETLAEKPSLVSIDVSFISLNLVLPAVHGLLLGDGADGEVICLVKPQFEAGRGEVGKRGVVRDAAVHAKVLRKFLQQAADAGFGAVALDYSPIRGPEGNIEYLAYLQRGGVHAEFDIDAIVDASHGVA